uniref:Uncharacterized protein n=1 Tax=Falco tinnunculus TaxID=100819 RepID=A0A8C4UH44_FALTI
MEAVARRQGGEEDGDAAAGGGSSSRRRSRALSLSGQSYWLDLWLFVLFDLALFVFIYLLP